MAPIGARNGKPLCRVDDRYTASVFPFLAGRSHRFGPYADARLRGSVLDMISALHQSTPVVRDCAPRHVLRFAGREELKAFLASPAQPWQGGPFAEAARSLLMPHAGVLAELVMDFEGLVESTRRARARVVITHGEPHPANVMAVDGRLVLIDWDTVGLAPPERDVSLIVSATNEGIERYQQATGIELSPAVITLYRLRWYLDDLASAIRMFRNAHHDTPDTRLWRDGLSGLLDQLPEWRAALA
jgi:spectinomycin phosphotransferase